MRIGIDVGGTHTDAVLLSDNTVLASIKTLTTADVTGGVFNALGSLLTQSGYAAADIDTLMIGTTQFTNAVVERKFLAPVGIIRLALPSGKGCPPLTDWPADLAGAVGGNVYVCHGGFLYDGNPLAPVNSAEIDKVIADINQRGIRCVAISSPFSTMNPGPEEWVRERVLKAIPDVRVTLSHQLGSLGLLERENSAILNASLLPFADTVVSALQQALRQHNFNCPVYISQNDGTLMSTRFVRQFPALTFASGPTNSLRGAYKLTDTTDAIVVDIGGTTSDIGVLQRGFPRESGSVVDVGGVRTNFRMPDIRAVGLGGGSLVSADGSTVGPQSCGRELVTEALVFGGNTLTVTDIAVASGAVSLGDPTRLANVPRATVNNAAARIQQLLNSNIEMMKPNAKPVPVILVGGGAVIIKGDLPAASVTLRPEHAGVANAIGAAIAQVGGESESLQSYRSQSREAAIEQVKQAAISRAVAAGAQPDTLRVVDIEETDVPYMDDGITRVRVKVVGELGSPGNPLTGER
ncbi:hydantoinase/oxoprolinase family protein [Alteromonas gilva]|uniref:Hydantoinase/oxoprolinase family protein n=1 Tax=Alteromonas gilva TaxID=2987522 RepID=A0ABT5KXI9_9ALTE|nr:hydantoinase/oxoprolinase family protein [Alteromonas gilva]MDC8829485.1 hydantoinase/oxoprolinase family protein [Alteromonas gilva]